ncbi:MAG: HesA/MoeB/ThiF family protein [Bacteroidota bacterium]
MNGQRYIRQTALSGFGSEGQAKLAASKVLVIGAGGLGIPVLVYLNAMGVGTLGIMDGDTVSYSNLHRQVLFDEVDVGRSKVNVAAQKLKAQNSTTHFVVRDSFLTHKNALEVIAPFDVVVDASDNFPTRYLVNDACVILNKPFVYGALHGFEGQVSVFNHNHGPTYRCLFPKMPGPEEVPDCNTNGVLGILPGIVGNFQALETVKVIAGIGEVLSGKLLIYDGLSYRLSTIKLKKNPSNLVIKELLGTYDLECGDGIKSISVNQLQDLLKDRPLQLIDVRTPKEYEGHHLEGAKNIPLPNIKERSSEIDFDQPIYCICQSGNRSLKAIKVLQKLNPNTLMINVTEGMDNLRAHAAKY